MENANGNGHQTVHARPLRIIATGAPAAVARLAWSVSGHDLRFASAAESFDWADDTAIRERSDLILLACAGRPTCTELKQLRRRFDKPGSRDPLPIVIVLAEADGRGARKLIDAGVAGIVVEETIAETLEPTLRAVSTGQLVYPRRLRTAAERPNLSYREKQALGMVVMGFTNREIAGKLWLAESTVKSHLSSAFEKLGVRSRSEAASLILDPNEGLGTGILTISGADGASPDVNDAGG